MDVLAQNYSSLAKIMDRDEKKTIRKDYRTNG
jgi:hypothetical protein